MSKLPLYDRGKHVGEGHELDHLWHARTLSEKNYIKSRSSYWPVKNISILTKVDPNRHARQAVIAFPETGAAFIVEDQPQLKAIIHKLIGVYQHIQAHGQSAVVSFGRED